MESMDLKFAPVIEKTSIIYAIQMYMFGPMAGFFGNASPNRGFNPPPASHALPPAAPPTCQPPIMCHQ